MGFLTTFYRDMIQQYLIVQIFLPHPTAPPAPLRPHLRSSEFYKAPKNLTGHRRKTSWELSYGEQREIP